PDQVGAGGTGLLLDADGGVAPSLGPGQVPVGLGDPGDQLPNLEVRGLRSGRIKDVQPSLLAPPQQDPSGVVGIGARLTAGGGEVPEPAQDQIGRQPLVLDEGVLEPPPQEQPTGGADVPPALLQCLPQKPREL